MLAWELLRCLHRAGFEVLSKGRPEIDVTEVASVRQTLADVCPDILINTAAYTAVDRAESEKNIAFVVNRDGAAHLAAACRDTNIPLLHVSTDYVFDGTATHPYREDDPTAPLGVYGQSKWEGEEAVRSCHRKHLIVRTAWLYGSHGTNFVKTILHLARERKVLRVVSDQRGCPTWSRDFAEALVTMCRTIEQEEKTIPWGIYHFCGAGQTTWYGFAQAIVEEAKAFEPLVVQQVVPTSTGPNPKPARRPANSMLDCYKSERAFGISPRLWRKSLHDCIQELYKCTPTNLETS